MKPRVPAPCTASSYVGKSSESKTGAVGIVRSTAGALGCKIIADDSPTASDRGGNGVLALNLFGAAFEAVAALSEVESLKGMLPIMIGILTCGLSLQDVTSALTLNSFPTMYLWLWTLIFEIHL